MEVKYLLTQCKRTNGTMSKGCVVHNTSDDAKQGFHAYLSAYAYGHEAGTDYVTAYVLDTNGVVIEPPVVWDNTVEPEPEPTPEPGE